MADMKGGLLRHNLWYERLDYPQADPDLTWNQEELRPSGVPEEEILLNVDGEEYGLTIL